MALMLGSFVGGLAGAVLLDIEAMCAGKLHIIWGGLWWECSA